MKSECCPHASTVGDTHLFNLHLLKRIDRFFQLLRGQKIEVGTAQDSIKFFFSSLVHHMVNDINHSRMGTAKNQDKPLFSIQYEGLVI